MIAEIAQSGTNSLNLTKRLLWESADDFQMLLQNANVETLAATLMTQHMKSISFLLLTVNLIFQTSVGQTIAINSDTSKKQVDKTIFIYGGGINKTFIKYVAGLTNKPNPKICFIPTASADNPAGIVAWYSNCEDLLIRLYVMRTFINSSPTQMTFEETIYH